MPVDNTVLLVEDDAPLRRSLEKFLSQAGYAFESCSTAREAIALAEKIRHDVVIIEYHLPDANGSSLLRKLMLIFPETAAILISEYDFPVVDSEFDRLPVGSYLKKPFDLAELEDALSSAFSKAGQPTRNEKLQPNSVADVVPASTFLKGTPGNGIHQNSQDALELKLTGKVDAN